MKRRVIAAIMSALMVTTLAVGCGGSGGSSDGGSSDAGTAGEETSGTEEGGSAEEADFTGEDPQLEKTVKILTIWAEDNDNGILLNKICENYKKDVNPNFDW